MEKVSAEMFLNAFKTEWEMVMEERGTEIMELFSSDSKWTKFMQASDGFLNRVRRRLSAELCYMTESYTIDALFVSGEDLLGRDGGYPGELHALIELENGPHVEEEMWKLVHWRSPLKVLIFYDYNDEERIANERKAKWLAGKLGELQTILDKVNRFHPENEKTEYLFVIGARRKPDGEIYWRAATNSSRFMPI